MSVRLIVNADDLGLAESVNRGIIETIERGIVTSTSLIVNMAACDDAIRRLRDARSRGTAVSVGLHFNVVAGQPMTACRTLLDDRTRAFASLPTLIRRAYAGRLNRQDIELELDAQLDRAAQLLEPMGLCVTHIDSHRHTHCLPSVFDVVLQRARQRGIGHVRQSHDACPLFSQPRAVLASLVLRTFLSRRTVLDGVGFTGIGAMGSRTFERDILAIVAALPPGPTELMVHPGYDSPELAAIDLYGAPRERELRVLTSPALRERLRSMGVELTRFGSTAAPA